MTWCHISKITIKTIQSAHQSVLKVEGDQKTCFEIQEGKNRAAAIIEEDKLEFF
jgi:hypothetical protein